ncbi:MAG: polysaccharide deacetylase family protein [Candidatus Omnitrophota bacterium]|nr:MAG: polysaccharide deacetylase family protein [Candidatus Omnitrophota bacterium]
MQKLIRRLALFLIVTVILLTAFYYLWLSPRYVVPILMYHRIADGPNESLYVSPDTFLRQMAYIKWRGYTVISLDELVEGIKSGKKFKHNTVVITFDDGYEDNYEAAYSVLKSNGFPATIFLISNYIDKKQGYLKWQEIEEMLKDSKITFGGHARNNIYLPDVKSKSRLKNEIAGCKKDIEAKIGQNIDYFCYPTGGFTEEIKKIVKEAGYKGACTTNRGFVRFNKDVYELKRIKIKGSDFVEKPLSFWAKLSGYYNVFRRGKKPY